MPQGKRLRKILEIWKKENEIIFFKFYNVKSHNWILRGTPFDIQEGAWKFIEIKNFTHLMSKKKIHPPEE